ncbi:ribosomal protein S9 [Wuchereria bancrofti]|nr:ribosomal protein S9 [Wuchereria bancrofti]
MVSLPGAHKEWDFIFEYRKSVAVGAKDVIFGAKVPPIQLVEGTNRRMAKVEVRLKASFAEVEVRDKGSGEYTVDGYSLDVFRSLQAREIFLAPLIVTDLLGKLDITGKITDGPGGNSVIPRIIRYGTSLCIAALFPEHFDKLRLAGLLTSDPRRRERYKINQKGARAKWIWYLFIFVALSSHSLRICLCLSAKTDMTFNALLSTSKSLYFVLWCSSVP